MSQRMTSCASIPVFTMVTINATRALIPADRIAEWTSFQSIGSGLSNVKIELMPYLGLKTRCVEAGKLSSAAPVRVGRGIKAPPQLGQVP